MDTFPLIIYFMLIAVAAAANSGYNYQQQNINPFPAASTNGIYPAQQAPPLPAFNIPSTPVGDFSHQAPQFANPVQQSVGFAPNAGGTASFQAQATQQLSAGTSNSLYQAPRQQQTIVSKDIYIHSAPEETEEIRNDLNSEVGPNRKNYRIVFIKAPSHNIRFNTQYTRQAQASNEEKTVIYVLAKKPDIANIQNDVSVAQTQQKASKPEVYFIKYQTPDEALRAQQEIQAQYEALGGSTQVSDEGIAPVTSVIGNGRNNGVAVGGGNAGGTSFAGASNFAQSATNIQQQIAQPAIGSQLPLQSGQNIPIPSNRYLPAKIK